MIMLGSWYVWETPCRYFIARTNRFKREHHSCARDGIEFYRKSNSRIKWFFTRKSAERFAKRLNLGRRPIQ